MLIDAGPEQSSDTVVSYLRKNKVKKLDYVVATHPHEDHIGSMAAVLSRFDVENFYAPKIVADTVYFNNMSRVLKMKNIKVKAAHENISLNLGKNSDCTIISPCSESYENINNYSCAISLTYGNVNFLFMGDAEESAENEMLANNVLPDCDVLKAGHHGSSTSSSKIFLETVSPSITVISVGKRNDFGHPSKSVINSLIEMNSQIYRTDIDGTIVLECNGNKIIKK